MRTLSYVAASLALAGLASSAPALAAAPENPLIDYPGFAALVRELGPVRETHRLPWAEFSARAHAESAILLDTRSTADFAHGHLSGAVNLPFSEFTDAKLMEVLGDKPDRPIYIYCNNNFRDNVAPVVSKRAPLALNIPTFVNLHGYGFTNVWELADVVSIADPSIRWVAGS